MSPITAGAFELGAHSPIGKHVKRDRTLVILNKLSQRDTSQAAVEELNRMIKVIWALYWQQSDSLNARQ